MILETNTGIFRVNVREHVRLQPVIRLGQLLSSLTIVILIEYNLKRAKERLIELMNFKLNFAVRSILQALDRVVRTLKVWPIRWPTANMTHETV